MLTRTIEIADGVKLNYIETDKFKTNYFSFNFITNLSRESAHLNALIPKILTHASKNYPSQAEIDKRLQYLYSASIGARNTQNGKYQVFGIIGDMLNDKYTFDTPVTDEMIKLLCDIIFNPFLEEGEFSAQFTESKKTDLIDLINAEINNKNAYAMNRCSDIMCKDEVFSIGKNGTVESVQAVTPKSLYEAYMKALQEYRIEIYFVGLADIEKIASAFKASFDKINRRVEKINDVEIVKKAEKVNQVCEIQNVTQGKLCMGFRTGRTIEDGDYHIMQLFSELYGGSPTSKLFINVREKKSLCYYCRSMITQKSGLMYVSAGIEPSNKEIAEKAILEQLEQVKKCKISDEELESAKKSLKNSYMQIYDNPGAMELWTLFRELSSNYDIPADEAKRVENTTKEEIAQFAKGITLDTVYFLKGEE